MLLLLIILILLLLLFYFITTCFTGSYRKLKGGEGEEDFRNQCLILRLGSAPLGHSSLADSKRNANVYRYNDIVYEDITQLYIGSTAEQYERILAETGIPLSNIYHSSYEGIYNDKILGTPYGWGTREFYEDINKFLNGRKFKFIITDYETTQWTEAIPNFDKFDFASMYLDDDGAFILTDHATSISTTDYIIERRSLKNVIEEYETSDKYDINSELNAWLSSYRQRLDQGAKSIRGGKSYKSIILTLYTLGNVLPHDTAPVFRSEDSSLMKSKIVTLRTALLRCSLTSGIKTLANLIKDGRMSNEEKDERIDEIWKEARARLGKDDIYVRNYNTMFKTPILNRSVYILHKIK